MRPRVLLLALSLTLLAAPLALPTAAADHCEDMHFAVEILCRGVHVADTVSGSLDDVICDIAC